MINQPPKLFSHRHKCSEVIPAPNVQCAFVAVFWPPGALLVAPEGWEPGRFLLSPGLSGVLPGQSLSSHSIAVQLEREVLGSASSRAQPFRGRRDLPAQTEPLQRMQTAPLKPLGTLFLSSESNPLAITMICFLKSLKINASPLTTPKPS